MPIIDEIIEKGQVERPYIGVGLANLKQIPQTYLQNLPNSLKEGRWLPILIPIQPLQKQDLQVQDVIVSINGTKLTILMN